MTKEVEKNTQKFLTNVKEQTKQASVAAKKLGEKLEKAELPKSATESLKKLKEQFEWCANNPGKCGKEVLIDVYETANSVVDALDDACDGKHLAGTATGKTNCELV